MPSPSPQVPQKAVVIDLPTKPDAPKRQVAIQVPADITDSEWFAFVVKLGPVRDALRRLHQAEVAKALSLPDPLVEVRGSIPPSPKRILPT